MLEHLWETHNIKAEEEEFDFKAEREKYLQSSLTTMPKRKKKTRQNTSSEGESSSSDPEKKNKPYRDSATKRGLARVENEQKNVSSAVEALKEDITKIKRDGNKELESVHFG